MHQLRLVIAGPGRAGGAIGLAARAVGHSVAGVLTGPSGRSSIDAPILSPGAPLPECDLLILAVGDDHIRQVAIDLSRQTGAAVKAACHLSGFTSVVDLAPLADLGIATGCLHPLQTLPDAEEGARALRDAHAAITGRATPLLFRFARSLGLHPFVLDDALKPTYHAAAAAASNFVVTALSVAAELFESAGVPLEAARPLTETIVGNVYQSGPFAALTGPVARGDVRTVDGQIEAARRVSPALGNRFTALVNLTAELAGRPERW